MKSGRSVFVQTDAIFFNFSLADYVDSNLNPGDALRSPFWMNVETVERDSGNSSTAQQVIEVDVDAMQPGSTTVVPVRAALTQTQLVFKKDSQAVIVSFCAVD